MSIIRNVTLGAKKFIDNDDILLFVGARQSGKTTILKQLQDYIESKNKKTHFLNLEDPDYLELLNNSPKNIFKIISVDLSERTFIFIDEVQYLKNPSNFLKYLHDEYKDKIKLIVSGSSAFYLDEKFKDSLAGRKKIFSVHTLSFREFLRFKNELGLTEKDFNSVSLKEEEKIILYFREYMVFGGYPRVVLSKVEEKKDVLRELAYSYIKKDIYEANVRREDVFYKLFKILAEQTGSLVNASELATTLGVSKSSIDHYLLVMRKSFHIYLINPFYKNIRKELTKMPKVYFSDTGLRNFFAGNFNSYELRNDKGVLLENIVYRQLLEQNYSDQIRFWRTINGHEIDFVIEEKKAIEVKSNLAQFKATGIQLFSKNYPEIEFNIVTLGKEKTERVKDYKILEAWQLPCHSEFPLSF